MSFHDHHAPQVAWCDAWTGANKTFYSNHHAEAHFTTSIGRDTQVADALVEIVEMERIRHRGDEFLVIDIGSGSGELLEQLRARLPQEVRLLGVDVRDRPPRLPGDIHWRQLFVDEEIEDITGGDGHHVGVVIAHEFLDDLPCDVIELDEELTPLVVLVDPVTGAEELGPSLADPAALRFLDHHDLETVQMWLQTWWPATRPGARREIGLGRERIWSKLTSIVRSGAAVAIDYAHNKSDRAAGLWDAGTIKGFAAGRPQRAVPDGSVNITSHVALDALAQPDTLLGTQAQILGTPTLTSWPSGLGSYTWLVQPIDRA